MKGVCFVYDDEELKTRKHRVSVKDIPEENLVLKHLNLTVNDGEFLCLVGHSGCGKSTTLRVLAGLQRPVDGSIAIGGRPLDGPGLDRSVVFQNYSLFPWMSVKKNVEFGVRQASIELKRNLSKQEISDIADEYLEKVNMGKAAELYPYQLSGGMQQRVAIARALAMNTEILLFDEPFGALDIKTRRELQSLMESLWMTADVRKTAVFVTHDIEEALLLADRIIFMSGGRFREEFRVNVARPRDPETYLETPAYKTLRSRLLDLFYSAEETQLDQADRERVYDGGMTL
jgi:ABC-type nitrate/sulfonate/bicarbonate transport system ATPase subunit